MIAQLRGRLVSAQPHCIVEVGGVGFELLVPEKDIETLRPDDSDVLFYTYLYVREDRLNLFGFLHAADRALFLRLIEVSGVGPRLALGALSLYASSAIVVAIRRGDAAFLRKLPGVGKKTAERLCLELGDKLDDIVSPASDTIPAVGSTLQDDVLMALTSLGMTKHAAQTALERMSWRPDEESSVEDVVREALRYAGSP